MATDYIKQTAQSLKETSIGGNMMEPIMATCYQFKEIQLCSICQHTKIKPRNCLTKGCSLVGTVSAYMTWAHGWTLG